MYQTIVFKAPGQRSKSPLIVLSGISFPDILKQDRAAMALRALRSVCTRANLLAATAAAAAAVAYAAWILDNGAVMALAGTAATAAIFAESLCRKGGDR